MQDLEFQSRSLILISRSFSMFFSPFHRIKKKTMVRKTLPMASSYNIDFYIRFKFEAKVIIIVFLYLQTALRLHLCSDSPSYLL